MKKLLLLLVVITMIAVRPLASYAEESSGRITPQMRNETTSPTTLLLAEDKKALLPIIVSPKASKDTEAVATELAQYLQKITGAKFEIKDGDGSSGIVLGTIAEFPTAGLDDALKIINSIDGREAFAIRTQPKRLLLLGATPKGVPHAAFRFLEKIGYRHFYPHPTWEIIPTIAKLEWNKDITDRPTILSRNVWFEAGSGGPRENQQYTDWRRHNLQAESFIVNAGHNMDSVIRANQAEFDKHPEYYAARLQADGTLKRDPASLQLELANPEVRKMIVQYAIDFFKQNPDADMVSIDPADNQQHSQSPESIAMGSVSDRVFGMANEVALALQKEFPGQGKMVGLYSYSGHWDPPSLNLEPNVHVLLSSIGQGEYTSAEREEMWTQRCQNLGFYEYFSVWLWSFDKLPGSWVNNIQGAAEAMRIRVKRGGTSISAESTSTWGSNGRGYYVVNKLMWNPDQDPLAIAQDFYDKAFGPAAEPMKKYFERLQPDNAKFLSKHLIALALRDLQQASDLAKDRPDVQARLDQIKLYLGYVYLDWMRNRDASTKQEDKEALSNEIMTHMYRISPYALTSWEMIRQQWGGNKYPGQDKADWMVDKPYTHDEIEVGFKDMLEYFKPSAVGEPLKFSDDLVPVNWGNALMTPYQPEENKQVYQGGEKYALYSVKGEPLSFTTWAGDAWGGINRFKILDAKNTEITSGRLNNKETVNHTIQVPGPGLYWLDYDDGGSYWAFTATPGTAATIPLGQTQDYRNMAILNDMYFYVPKGTKAIEYYYARTAFHPGGPHQVITPDNNIAIAIVNGKKVETIDVNGDWVSVPVPAGLDGKLWRLHQAVQGLFWFNNMPSYIAGSPDALLLPREVAIKDGLTIKK